MSMWASLVLWTILIALTEVYLLRSPTHSLILHSFHRSTLLRSKTRFETEMEYTSQTIEVYSAPGCKFCRIAKAKLSEMNLPYTNIDISIEDDDNVFRTPLQLERIAFASSHTVPQIYITGEHIGGCTELLAEIESGQFVDTVARYGIMPKPVPDNHERTQDAPAATSTIATSLVHPEKGEPLNCLRFRTTPALPGHVSALELSRRLQEQASVLLDEFATPDGRKVDYHRLLRSAHFAAYANLTRQLQLCSLAELGEFSHVEKVAFWGNLYNALIVHANCVVRDEAASALPLQSPEAIAARGAFFSGRTGAVYRVGGGGELRAAAGDIPVERTGAAPCATGAPECTNYIDVTPDIIEHAILRGNRPHPSQVDAAISADATASGVPGRDANYFYETLTYVPDTHPVVVCKLPVRRVDFDARIHFILNCGALSCPPIKVLRAGARASEGVSVVDHGNVEQALHAATAAYLSAEVRVDADSQIVYLPRLLMWYEKDFGFDVRSVLGRVVRWLPHTSSAKAPLQELLQSGVAFPVPTVKTAVSSLHWKVVYNPYDWSHNST
jgi:glutaredoxin